PHDRGRWRAPGFPTRALHARHRLVSAGRAVGRHRRAGSHADAVRQDRGAGRSYQPPRRRAARVSRPTDYYALLGVARDAGEADIKKAYRRLATQYHPARVAAGAKAAAAETFKETTEASEVLRRP